MKSFNGYMHGINLGGWLSQCVHTYEHYDSFISENDIERIASWGLDHVRVPVDYQLMRDENHNDIEKGYGYIDCCLEWCKKHGLNMILDLHKTAGFSFDESTNAFFESEPLQDRFVELWIELAKRYGNYGESLVFELLNEVVEDSVAEQWNGIIKRTISAIRAIAPNVKIIIGGVRNNSVLRVKGLDLPYDENVVYTFHFYEPLIFTHQTAHWVNKMTADFHTEYPAETAKYYAETEKFLPDDQREFYHAVKTKSIDRDFFEEAFKEAIQTAEERGVALYCGEYGVIDKTSLSSALNWYTDISSVFDQFKIGRAAWTYKKLDFGITDEHYAEIFDMLVKLL